VIRKGSAASSSRKNNAGKQVQAEAVQVEQDCRGFANGPDLVCAAPDAEMARAWGEQAKT
jgi:hypothetical protein